MAVQAGPAGSIDEHPHVDDAGIAKRKKERATGVDDDTPQAFDVADALAQAFEPLDARLLHITEVDGIVDVPLRVHVAPSYGDRNAVHQLARRSHRGSSQKVIIMAR